VRGPLAAVLGWPMEENLLVMAAVVICAIAAALLRRRTGTHGRQRQSRRAPASQITLNGYSAHMSAGDHVGGATAATAGLPSGP